MDSRSADTLGPSAIAVDKVTIQRCVNGFVVEHEANPRSAELTRQWLATIDACIEHVRLLLSQ